MIRKIKNKVNMYLKNKRYSASAEDYNANKYWNERHKTFSTDSLKGVGINSKTEEENLAMYESAKYIFNGIFHDLIKDENIKVLEIGYGTGFYTKILNNKCEQYIGVDIVDTHIDNIMLTLSNKKIVKLLKVNVGEEIIDTDDELFDLIIMIDVTQHIVNDEKLIFNLKENVQNKLKNGGIFITTDACTNKKISFYEKTRNLEFYSNTLDKCEIIKNLVQFRDKYIFAFRKL